MSSAARAPLPLSTAAGDVGPLPRRLETVDGFSIQPPQGGDSTPAAASSSANYSRRTLNKVDAVTPGQVEQARANFEDARMILNESNQFERAFTPKKAKRNSGIPASPPKSPFASDLRPAVPQLSTLDSDPPSRPSAATATPIANHKAASSPPIPTSISANPQLRTPLPSSSPESHHNQPAQPSPTSQSPWIPKRIPSNFSITNPLESTPSRVQSSSSIASGSITPIPSGSNQARLPRPIRRPKAQSQGSQSYIFTLGNAPIQGAEVGSAVHMARSVSPGSSSSTLSRSPPSPRPSQFSIPAETGPSRRNSSDLTRKPNLVSSRRSSAVTVRRTSSTTRLPVAAITAPATPAVVVTAGAPVGVGAPQPPQLERRSSLVTSFSSPACQLPPQPLPPYQQQQLSLDDDLDDPSAGFILSGPRVAVVAAIEADDSAILDDDEDFPTIERTDRPRSRSGSTSHSVSMSASGSSGSAHLRRSSSHSTSYVTIDFRTSQSSHPQSLPHANPHVPDSESMSSPSSPSDDQVSQRVAKTGLSRGFGFGKLRPPKRARELQSSKSALELVTKTRVTSNMAIYMPPHLWKQDILVDECESPDCSHSFLAPTAKPIEKLSSLASAFVDSFQGASTINSPASLSPYAPQQQVHRRSTSTSFLSRSWLSGGSTSLSSTVSPSSTRPTSSSSFPSLSSLSSSLNLPTFNLPSLNLPSLTLPHIPNPLTGPTPITLTRTRHHCRMCGGVFCSTCSNYEAALFDSDKLPGTGYPHVPEGSALLDWPVFLKESSSPKKQNTAQTNGAAGQGLAGWFKRSRSGSENDVAVPRPGLDPAPSSDSSISQLGQSVTSAFEADIDDHASYSTFEYDDDSEFEDDGDLEGPADEDEPLMIIVGEDEQGHPIIKPLAPLPTTPPPEVESKQNGRRESWLAGLTESIATGVARSATSVDTPDISSPSSSSTITDSTSTSLSGSTCASNVPHRTPPLRTPSPLNPHPPTFSLPLHGAALSLLASSLPASHSLVRVERICKGCAKKLRGTAGRGWSALTHWQEWEREQERKRNEEESEESEEVKLKKERDAAERERAREEMWAWRERAHARDAERAALVSSSSSSSLAGMVVNASVLPPSSPTTPRRQRRRSRAGSSSVEPSLPQVDEETPLSAPPAPLVSQVSSTFGTAAAIGTPFHRGSSSRLAASPNHQFSPLVSSPLSSPPVASSLIEPPRRTSSSSTILPPASALLPVIPEPEEPHLDLPPELRPPTRSNSLTFKPRGPPSTVNGARIVMGNLPRPAMRRAHSNNEVEFPRSSAGKAAASSPLARSSSLKKGSSKAPPLGLNTVVEPLFESLRPSGKHVAWLPTSTSSLSPSSVALAANTQLGAPKPAPLIVANPLPAPTPSKNVSFADEVDFNSRALSNTKIDNEKKQKPRERKRTFMLFGQAHYGPSLRDILGETLGAEGTDCEEEEQEIKPTLASAKAQSGSAELERSLSIEITTKETSAVHDPAAFPASPPIERNDLPLLFAPYGKRAPVSYSTLHAIPPSRITAPSVPLAYFEPKRAPPGAQPTPPGTRQSSSTDLASKNRDRARAEVYAARTKAEEELAARRRAAATAESQQHGKQQQQMLLNPYGYGYAGAYGNTMGAERPPIGGPDERVVQVVAGAQAPRDLVKPLYAMTLSTF